MYASHVFPMALGAWGLGGFGACMWKGNQRPGPGRLGRQTARGMHKLLLLLKSPRRPEHAGNSTPMHVHTVDGELSSQHQPNPWPGGWDVAGGAVHVLFVVCPSSCRRLWLLPTTRGFGTGQRTRTLGQLTQTPPLFLMVAARGLGGDPNI